MSYALQSIAAAAIAGLAAYGAVKIIEELAENTRKAPAPARARLHNARLELARMRRAVTALERETAEEEGDDEAADIMVNEVVRDARTGAAQGIRLRVELPAEREEEERPAGAESAAAEARR